MIPAACRASRSSRGGVALRGVVVIGRTPTAQATPQAVGHPQLGRPGGIEDRTPSYHHHYHHHQQRFVTSAAAAVVSLSPPPPVSPLPRRTAGGVPTRRPYSPSAARLDDTEGGNGNGEEGGEGGEEEGGGGLEPRRHYRKQKKPKNEIAEDYNRRRAAYKRQVSALRRNYAEEVAQQVAEDKRKAEIQRRELTRRRLERQRRKNIASAQHAIHQEQIRQQRDAEFQEHLRVMQEKRDAEQALFDQARQLAIDELEAEAPLWLTTPDEVEAAFTHEAVQLLLARPGGVLGAPNPSSDAHFWHLETHTWHMNRTYQSQRDVLLERLQEAAYDEANIDRDFWTPERVREHEIREDKARLRASVQVTGRLELLQRQRQMLLDDAEAISVANDSLPRSPPVPNLRHLQNHKAIEREGSRLLLEDPTRFFVFDGMSAGDPSSEGDGWSVSSSYEGPSLGAPIGLRDRLREGSHQNSVYPVIVGRTPRPDTRTDREKRQQERERKLWAAAQAEAHSQASDDDLDIELAAQQQTIEDMVPDLDYDELQWDWQDEEWTKGTDPVADANILNTPREQRYTEDDIEWVAQKMEANVAHLEQQLRQDLDQLKYGVMSEARRESGLEQPFDASSLEAALFALPDTQLLALSDLDDRHGGTETLSDDDLAQAAKAIPGLTKEQILAVLGRNKSAPE